MTTVQTDLFTVAELAAQVARLSREGVDKETLSFTLSLLSNHKINHYMKGAAGKPRAIESIEKILTFIVKENIIDEGQIILSVEDCAEEDWTKDLSELTDYSTAVNGCESTITRHNSRHEVDRDVRDTNELDEMSESDYDREIYGSIDDTTNVVPGSHSSRTVISTGSVACQDEQGGPVAPESEAWDRQCRDMEEVYKANDLLTRALERLEVVASEFDLVDESHPELLRRFGSGWENVLVPGHPDHCEQLTELAVQLCSESVQFYDEFASAIQDINNHSVTTDRITDEMEAAIKMYAAARLDMGIHYRKKMLEVLNRVDEKKDDSMDVDA